MARPMFVMRLVAAGLLVWVITLVSWCNSHTARTGTTEITKIMPRHPRGHGADPQAIQLEDMRSRFAFATFLTNSSQDSNYLDNNYFIATRILAYQLLHAPETRSRDRNIPFIVLVTPEIEQTARDRLHEDGAIVIEVPRLTASWIKPSRPNWRDVLTKLRLWELVDFDRVAFLDADTIILQPLDDVFTDPAVEEQTTIVDRLHAMPGASTVPSTYVLAGNARHQDSYGETASHASHFCANFFVLRPSLDLLRHYVSIIQTPDSFFFIAPEETMLNMVHDWKSSMPWKQLNMTFNVIGPQMSHLQGGRIKSFHDKWWGRADSPHLRGLMDSWKRRMELFYETRSR